MQSNEKREKENLGSTKIKKYRSAYILFSIDNRQKLKLENPDKSSQQITKLIAELWKNLSSLNKEVYINKEKLEKSQDYGRKYFIAGETYKYLSQSLKN
jgi:hypothetical protein